MAFKPEHCCVPISQKFSVSTCNHSCLLRSVCVEVEGMGKKGGMREKMKEKTEESRRLLVQLYLNYFLEVSIMKQFTFVLWLV